MFVKRYFVTIIVLFFVLPNILFAQDNLSPAETFGHLPEVIDVQISPDGTKLMLLQNISGRITIVTIDLSNPTSPNGITPGEGEYNWVRWISNNKILASLSYPTARNNGVGLTELEETRLLYMDWNGKNRSNPIGSNLLINPTVRSSGIWRAPQIQDEVIDFLKDDQDHVIIELDPEIPLFDSVYKLNLNSRKSDRLVRARSPIKDWKLDFDKVVRFGEGRDRKGYLKEALYKGIYRKNDDSDWITLFKFDELTAQKPFDFEGFTLDPDIIYISKSNEFGRIALYKYHVDDQQVVEEIVSHEKHDIYGIKTNDRGEISQYSFFDYKENTVRMDEDGKELQDLFDTAFPDHRVTINSKTKDKNTLIVYATSPKNPGDFFLINLENRTKGLIVSNYRELDRSQLSDMQPISYLARDGLEIHGYLSLPVNQGNKNFKTVILPHGGPMVRDSWRFDYLVQFLTTRGYAVLQMNYRGSVGYGVKFERMGHQEWGRKMLEDINDGTKWMIEQGYTDPKNICIMGGSYGGYAALQAVVKDPSLYKCSISLAPVVDIDELLNYQRRFTGHKVYENYVVSDEWNMDDASPIHNIENINIPVLLLHGDIDRSVRVQQSRTFYNKMRKEKKDIRYIEFEGGDHYLSKEVHRIEFLKQVEMFLAKNL